MIEKVKLSVILLLSVFLIACAKTNDIESALTDTEIKINDTIIALDTDVKNDYSDILGNKINVLESKSCLFDGNDKEYQYEKGTVITYPSGEQNKISSITVNTKEAVLSKDIKIGDDIKKIKSLYGDSPTESSETVYTYEFKDKTGISFFLEDNKIINIEIYLIQ